MAHRYYLAFEDPQDGGTHQALLKRERIDKVWEAADTFARAYGDLAVAMAMEDDDQLAIASSQVWTSRRALRVMLGFDG